jgi:hypothetical protein
LGGNIVMSIIGPFAASSLSIMNANYRMRISYIPVMHCEKMAITMPFHRSAVIEFLVKEGNSAAVIYK